MLEIIIKPLARQDLLAIWQYTYDKWGSEQADSYLKEMASTFEALSLSPQLGRSADDIYQGIRVYPSKQHIILYQFNDHHLDIVRVLHKRMDVNRHPLA